MTLSQVANVEQVKQVNSALVYRLINEQGPLSRVRLAELSALAPASITKLSRQLLEAGLIRELEESTPTGGRPAIALACQDETLGLVAGRLGRDRLQLSLYNLKGEELANQQWPVSVTEQQAVMDQLLQTLGDFIAQYGQRLQRLIAVGLTMPGLIDPQQGMVFYMPRYQLRELALGPWLAERLGLPVYLGNDTRAHALAEHLIGAAQGCHDAILVSVHQGTGAGILSNGRIFLGKNSNVGEIGHIQVEPFGQRCHCGNFGCLETIVANPAILGRTAQLLAQGHPSQLAADNLTIEALCQAAQAGDPLARHVLEHAAEQLGRTLAIMVNLFNPQKLLLAGEIMQCRDILWPVLQRCIDQQSLPSFHQDLPIELARFQHAGTIGGYALIKRALYESDLLQRLMTPSVTE
ncbi:ROK family protein [Pseudaeromonas paramecii]|uniref:ROK family protein n=1 Tax=Pseudaeromonas paramecii TaxID=2138166 RepID=A0ABP8Q6T5_9GAMM